MIPGNRLTATLAVLVYLRVEHVLYEQRHQDFHSGSTECCCGLKDIKSRPSQMDSVSRTSLLDSIRSDQFKSERRPRVPNQAAPCPVTLRCRCLRTMLRLRRRHQKSQRRPKGTCVSMTSRESQLMAREEIMRLTLSLADSDASEAVAPSDVSVVVASAVSVAVSLLVVVLTESSDATLPLEVLLAGAGVASRSHDSAAADTLWP